MRRFFYNNGLSLAAGSLFVLGLLGQSLVGQRVYNQDRADHGRPEATYAAYLRTGHFSEAVFENWESEFLQMGMYVLLTAFLVQKGSAESKKPRDELEGRTEERDEDPRLHRDDQKAPWPVRAGGWGLRLYENSLSIAFLCLFLLAFVAHAVSGTAEYNLEQLEQGAERVTVLTYMSSARFWFESLQNWQSEFLAVVAIVVLSIFLRQRGSPESKPVHAPVWETGAG